MPLCCEQEKYWRWISSRWIKQQLTKSQAIFVYKRNHIKKLPKISVHNRYQKCTHSISCITNFKKTEQIEDSSTPLVLKMSSKWYFCSQCDLTYSRTTWRPSLSSPKSYIKTKSQHQIIKMVQLIKMSKKSFHSVYYLHDNTWGSNNLPGISFRVNLAQLFKNQS